jgi:diacylglycerol O-acyltransferase-1
MAGSAPRKNAAAIKNAAQKTQLNGNGTAVPEKEKKPERKPAKYRHVAAIHYKPKTSCLSHDSEVAPSFLGFRNLLVLVVVVMNLRLVVENYMKYGVLICIGCHDYRRSDVQWALALYAIIPCHLFVAYLIERAAAGQAKRIVGQWKKNDGSESPTYDAEPRLAYAAWRNIAIAHAVNASSCLLLTSGVVYYLMFHPLLGTISELHAIIVWLKICSYALTNRDLRHAMLHQKFANTIPDTYASCPYPQNVTFKNLTYFWWAPTLVYQPVYPRTATIRWGFVGKRVTEALALSVFIWLASAQYAVPVLLNSLSKMAAGDLASIVERLMKLSTISLIIWLAGFFAVFQSGLNALAEVMRFGDREFYTDWWNSPSVGVYWRTWNKPVTQFMKRHVFSPLIGRGWSNSAASAMVFIFSGFLHELLVGVPTHNIIGKLLLFPHPLSIHPCIRHCQAKHSSLTRNTRCCLFGNGSPNPHDHGHHALGEDAEYQRQDCRELHLLGQFLLGWPAFGGAAVLFCVAGKVRQCQ